MQGDYYDIMHDARGSASGDPWTAPQGVFAYEDPWRRPKAPVELNIIKKANSVRANQLRDRTERCYDPHAIDKVAPAVHYGIPHDDATRIDVYVSAQHRSRTDHPYNVAAGAQAAGGRAPAPLPKPQVRSEFPRDDIPPHPVQVVAEGPADPGGLEEATWQRGS